MNSYSETGQRRLYRDADRAMLGGVCAGFANHFGLNLKVTRFLCIIAFLMAMPFALIGYIAAVCLIPAASYREREVVVESGCCWSRSRRRRKRRRQERCPEPEAPPARRTLAEVREKYKTLDQRLAELEKKVTSPRFQLEQEFRKL